MFNLIVIGGQDCSTYELFEGNLMYLLQNRIKMNDTIILSHIGDKFVKKFAMEHHFAEKEVKARWDIYKGKDAINVRNYELFNNATAILFFDKRQRDLIGIFETAKSKNLNMRKIAI